MVQELGRVLEAQRGAQCGWSRRDERRPERSRGQIVESLAACYEDRDLILAKMESQ